MKIKQLALGTAAALVAAYGFAMSAQAQQGGSCCPPVGKDKDGSVADAKLDKGVQSATIVVDNGFSPATVKVKAGTPVRLTFEGRNLGCANEVVFESLKLRKSLAQGKRSIVEFTPKKSGDLAFACGMGMHKGKVLVR